MAAGDFSFARGTSTCSCARIVTQASLRPWIGVRLANSNFSSAAIYFLNYRIQVNAISGIDGRGAPFSRTDADVTWQFSTDRATYGNATVSGYESIYSGRTGAFGLRNPVEVLPQIQTLGSGSYVFRCPNSGYTPFILESFTPGDSYLVVLIDEYDVKEGIAPKVLSVVTRTFSQWFSPETMFGILADDLHDKLVDAVPIPRQLSSPSLIFPAAALMSRISGAFSDRAFQTVYIQQFTRAMFYEGFDTDYLANSFIGSLVGQEITNFGHAANHTLSLSKLVQGFFFGGSEAIGFPAFLMRSDILINGNHHVETSSQFGLHPEGSPLILECENISVSCPATTYPVEPWSLMNDQVKDIFLNRLCGDPDRSVNF